MQNPHKQGKGLISLSNKMIAPGVDPKLRRIRVRRGGPDPGCGRPKGPNP